MKNKNINVILSCLTAFVLVVPLLTVSCYSQESISLEELRRRNQQNKNKTKNKENAKVSIPRVLAEGSDSNVEVPFVFVARDSATLQNLSRLVDGFSMDSKIDFQKQAVVAAFSGTKNTGGYSVLIKKKDGKVHVEDLAPVHGSIVTTVITKPYRVSLIDIGEEETLDVVLSETNPKNRSVMSWKKNMSEYKVTSGEFQFSGGFIGVEKKFAVKGTVSEMKYGDLKSFVFDLEPVGTQTGKKMTGIATAIQEGNEWSIARFEPGAMIDSPHPPFVVSITATSAGYAMGFEPGKRPYVTNDGYSGSGKIEIQ